MGNRQQRGFNMIELMVVVGLTSIVLAIGVPSFREFMAAQRVKSTAFDIAATLLQARSEAVKRNTSVTLARTGETWESGWSVQVGGNTLATQERLQNVTITPVSDPDTASIDYRGNGRIDPPQRVTLQVAGANTSAVRCITIDGSGVPNTTAASCPTP
jgi:type IV fimbrial biogenesis protein FimT